MKKIISLILVVLLCLPAVYIPVSADGADTYTITAASGADKTSNDYLNIDKYLAYYDGGDTLAIPEGYITVEQWKANIANPVINANGVADADYITSDCTLTLTMDDGVTTKEVVIDAVDYNYLLATYDKKETTTFANNSLGLSYGKGSKATVTTGAELISDSDYALTLDVKTASDATSNSSYVNVMQTVEDINTCNMPYIVSMTISSDSYASFNKSQIGFINTTGNGRVMFTSSALDTSFKEDGNVKISFVVYPKADVYDVYVDGVLAEKNRTTIDTKNNQSYSDYKYLFVRFYNMTKVNNAYEDLSLKITNYEIRYGYGNLNAPIYVEPEIEISNYTDGAKIATEDIVNLEAVTNSDDMKTAALYIDGIKVDEATVNNKAVVLDMSSMGYGDHSVEVRMYPEIGAYVSETVAVSVADFIDISDYTITFDEFEAGETPVTLSKPAEYFGATNFINYSNESLEDSTVIVNDAYVEYYDDVRGNVFHTKADPASNTEKTGRRIEIYQSNTANNMAVNFDMMFESFSGVNFTFLETRGTGVNAAVVIGEDGLLTMDGTTTSETTSIQLETGVWYNFDAEFYCTMGGIVKLNVYDESGSLIGSMESVNGAPYTDRVRIYTPYNKGNLQSGEAYIDNVKTTIISTTGSIGEITATTDDLNTLTAVLNGVSKVDGVELVNSNGDVEILGYSYNIDDSVLTVSTSQPLVTTENYTLVVYADSYAVPLTVGFEVAGSYVKVDDSYFYTQRGKNYVALNVTNKTEKDSKVTVLMSEWDGEKLVSMKSETITVATGENKYSVEITGDIENTKIMPVSSLGKPILLSNNVITK